MLISDDTDCLLEALAVCQSRKPVLYPVTAQNLERIAAAVKGRPAVLALKSAGVESLIPLTNRLRELGIEDALLDPGSRDLQSTIRDQTLIRRAALKQGFRPLGYPSVSFPCFMTR